MLTCTTGSRAASAFPSARAAAARAATARSDRVDVAPVAANTGAGAANKTPFGAGADAVSRRVRATRGRRGKANEEVTAGRSGVGGVLACSAPMARTGEAARGGDGIGACGTSAAVPAVVGNAGRSTGATRAARGSIDSRAWVGARGGGATSGTGGTAGLASRARAGASLSSAGGVTGARCSGSNSDGSRGASVVSLPIARAASRSRKSFMARTAPGRPGGGAGSARGCRPRPSGSWRPACPPRAACAAPRRAAPATGSGRRRTTVAIRGRSPGSATRVAGRPADRPAPSPARSAPAARAANREARAIRRHAARRARNVRAAARAQPRRRRSFPAPAGRGCRAGGTARGCRARRAPAWKRRRPHPAAAGHRSGTSPRPWLRIAGMSPPRRSRRRTGARAIRAAARRADPAASPPVHRQGLRRRSCSQAATVRVPRRTARPRVPRPAAAARGWACAWRSAGGYGEARLGRLRHTDIALPALVLQLQVLDRHRVRVRVQVGHRLVLRDPAAVQLVGERELAGLVVDLEDQVLAEVLQRDFRAEPGAEVPHLVRPLLELGVVGDAALDGDRLVLGAPRRLARAAGVAALAVLDHFGGALQSRHLADAGHVAAIPLHPELEVLVRIEALRIDAELSHGGFLKTGS